MKDSTATIDFTKSSGASKGDASNAPIKAAISLARPRDGSSPGLLSAATLVNQVQRLFEEI